MILEDVFLVEKKKRKTDVSLKLLEPYHRFIPYNQNESNSNH